MKPINGAFVCWRCLAEQSRPVLLAVRPQLRPARTQHTSGLGASILPNRRYLATVREHADAALPQPTDSSLPDPTDEHPARIPIRERLRIWEVQNPPLTEQLISRDYAAPGATRNAYSRGESTMMTDLDGDEEKQTQPLFDGDDLVDLRTDSVAVQAGDLVEVTSDTWRVQLLAICLGRFHGYDHFYTNTGRWFTGNGIRSLFTVPNFASAAELRPVIDALPPTGAPAEVLNILQELRETPTRDVGSALIRKMQEFVTESEIVYQANVARLDNAPQFLGKTEQYLTLHELAEVLLLKNVIRHGKYPPAALYAVHKALMRDDICFRPFSGLTHKQSYLFEVSSAEDVAIVHRVLSMVRMLYEDPLQMEGPLSDSRLAQTSLGEFILKARKLIDHSRETRRWLPHGMLGPELGTAKEPLRINWTEHDKMFLHFAQLWASYEKFSRSSRVHGIGSMLLRAIDRYDAEFLTSTTGWTFLQEVGWVSPWDIQARYTRRLPGVPVNRTGGLLPPPLPENAKDLLQDDIFAGMRQDWRHIKAYCIDAETATDIDDAVSLERTSNPGEYWIHVHVADPGSRIHPGKPLAERAALVPQTAYLPGHFSRMFPESVVQGEFSLAPDRPCLTFSAKVNEDGVVLEHKITPGIVHDVMYITAKEVSMVCDDVSAAAKIAQHDVFSVGTPPTIPWPCNRTMTKAEELSSEDVENLETLSRLAKALQAVRLSKGAMPLYWPRPSTQVSFENAQIAESEDGLLHCSGDPHIRIGYDGSFSSPLVESTMRLAGEVAARWCAERDIPVPYRTQPDAVRNLSLLRSFTENTLYPQLYAGQRPDESQWRAMRALLGADDIAAVPAPHFTMGADMYTKATSPLRRYADLLVHWQISAALLEEKRRGASLKNNNAQGEKLNQRARHGSSGSAHNGFLPYSRQRLEHDVLPMLRVRERTMRALDNLDGNSEWMLQALVRAWKFGDISGGSDESSSVLPKTFRFTITDMLGRRAARGRLDWFDLRATLVPEGIAEGADLRMVDLRAGDVLEVALADVNVHRRQVAVEAIRKL